MAAIGSVEAEVAVSRPPAFVAVTSTRRLRATSADVTVYVPSVAPSMSDCSRWKNSFASRPGGIGSRISATIVPG